MPCPSLEEVSGVDVPSLPPLLPETVSVRVSRRKCRWHLSRRRDRLERSSLGTSLVDLSARLLTSDGSGQLLSPTAQSLDTPRASV